MVLCTKGKSEVKMTTIEVSSTLVVEIVAGGLVRVELSEAAGQLAEAAAKAAR